KNGDAARITVTGRGYLQVGNNEVYELFQSAWSGAPYTKEAIGAEDEVALVTDLGLVPLSEVSAEENEGKKDKKTEIDAVVEEIERVQDRKSTRLNSSHVSISYAVFCFKEEKEALTTTLSVAAIT